METPNYAIPEYGAGDAPDLGAQYNSAMEIIDLNLKEIEDAASGGEEKADAAQTTANQAVGKADAAQTTADQAVGKADAAQTTADQAVGKADAAQTTADQNAQNIDILSQRTQPLNKGGTQVAASSLIALMNALHFVTPVVDSSRVLPSGTDLNAFYKIGTFIIEANSNPLNLPPGYKTAKVGRLDVVAISTGFRNFSPGNVAECAFPFMIITQENNIWVRYSYGTAYDVTFGEWRQIINHGRVFTCKTTIATITPGGVSFTVPVSLNPGEVVVGVVGVYPTNASALIRRWWYYTTDNTIKGTVSSLTTSNLTNVELDFLVKTEYQ